MKKKVLVVFGGVSSEHDVSLVSASSILGNIPSDRYDVRSLGITKEGFSYLYKGDYSRLPGGGWLEDEKLLERCIISPDRGHHGIVHMDSGEVEYIDVVFPVLHGKNGEDGTIQGLFEISGIPYVGCDTVSSAVCMDKAFTNLVADFNGVSQAKWMAFTSFEFGENSQAVIEKSEKLLGYPVFVKPANAGSSVGISKASSREELMKACSVALAHDRKVILEESVTGTEVECAVLGNEEPVASVVGEIVPCNDFYDYDAKYLAQSSELHIPARLTEEKMNEIRETAAKVYKMLGCSGMARVDFFVRKEDEKVMLNEVNTIPGFTSISMYPKLFGASGVPYGELVDRLITYALERNK